MKNAAKHCVFNNMNNEDDEDDEFTINGKDMWRYAVILGVIAVSSLSSRALCQCIFSLLSNLSRSTSFMLPTHISSQLTHVHELPRCEVHLSWFKTKFRENIFDYRVPRINYFPPTIFSFQSDIASMHQSHRRGPGTAGLPSIAAKILKSPTVMQLKVQKFSKLRKMI